MTVAPSIGAPVNIRYIDGDSDAQRKLVSMMVGRSIDQMFPKQPAHIGRTLPAMGYSDQQLRDLETTINASGADVVVIGTPMDLRRIVKIKLPAVQVGYDIQEIGHPTLEDVLREHKFI